MKSNLVKITNIVLVSFVLLLFSDKAKASNDTLGISLQKVLFFKIENSLPTNQARKYKNSFKPETSNIYVEVNVKNLLYKVKSQKHNVSFVFNYINDVKQGRVNADFEIKKESVTANIERGLGWGNEKGNWRLGRYTVQIFIDNTLFAEKDFFINSSETDFVTLQNVKTNIYSIKNSSSGVHQDIIQQYKIDPYFNSFYGFVFSKDGYDIGYSMANYSKTSYEVKRNMHLFKNNKQIMPVYFNILPVFDENLKNFSVASTWSKQDIQKNTTLLNGVVMFNSWLWNYASPDGSKYVYPVFAAANEFLFINNEKVIPKNIIGAKSFSITHNFYSNPIVFLKNDSQGYDAYFSGKFKIGKEKGYALFCENRMVSKKYSGDISIPQVSDDNKNIAYIASNKKSSFIVLNGEKNKKEFKSIESNIIFCGVEPSVIYKAKIGGDWYIVKNDKIVSDGHKKIGTFTADSNGNNVAYSAKDGKIWDVYINKTKVASNLDGIGELVINNKGNKVAFAAKKDNSMFVMVNNNIVSPEFETTHQLVTNVFRKKLALTNLCFNNVGNKVAYLVGQNNSSYDEGTSETNKRYYYVMIDNERVSPEMYGASVLSKNNEGELFYAGIEIGHFILHHVRIRF